MFANYKARESKGHIEFNGLFEYFRAKDSVYRASLTNTIDLNTGYRTGARWECCVSKWGEMRRLIELSKRGN